MECRLCFHPVTKDQDHIFCSICSTPMHWRCRAGKRRPGQCVLRYAAASTWIRLFCDICSAKFDLSKGREELATGEAAVAKHVKAADAVLSGADVAEEADGVSNLELSQKMDEIMEELNSPELKIQSKSEEVGEKKEENVRARSTDAGRSFRRFRRLRESFRSMRPKKRRSHDHSPKPVALPQVPDPPPPRRSAIEVYREAQAERANFVATTRPVSAPSTSGNDSSSAGPFGDTRRALGQRTEKLAGAEEATSSLAKATSNYVLHSQQLVHMARAQGEKKYWWWPGDWFD